MGNGSENGRKIFTGENIRLGVLATAAAIMLYLETRPPINGIPQPLPPSPHPGLSGTIDVILPPLTMEGKSYDTITFTGQVAARTIFVRTDNSSLSVLNCVGFPDDMLSRVCLSTNMSDFNPEKDYTFKMEWRDGKPVDVFTAERHLKITQEENKSLNLTLIPMPTPNP